MSDKKDQINRVGETRIEEFIKELNIEELILLNRMVVERIKLLNQIATSNEMRKYNIGEQVQFTDNHRRLIAGRIIRINKKTVSILTEDNTRWNVHPSCIQ